MTTRTSSKSPARRQPADALRSVAVPIITAAAVIFLAFAFLIYGFVFSNGLCCADDSTNAVVAKNLAFGKGYLNTILAIGVPGSEYFDPEISTGPTLNVPAAGLIYVVGNVPWAPGFITATFTVILLLATAIFVSKWAGVLRAAAYLALLVLLLYAVTAGIHFEHWDSLLGEGPAALLVIAGTSALAVQPARRSWIFASGLLFGLAVTTKLLAAVSFSAVGVWFLWRFLAAKQDRARRFVDGLIALGAFCLPAASFELWKMASLGFSGYLTNLRQFRAFVFNRSSDHATTSAFWRADGYSYAMHQHFGFSAPLLLVVLVGCAIPFYVSIQDLRARRLFTWLAAGATVNAAWWLFISIGWPRYALIGLCLYFAALSCVVFFVRARWAVAAALSILLLFAFDCGLSRLEAPVKFVAETRYRETPRIRNLLRTASLLEHLGNERPFVMSWWGTAIDSEYALPTVENFVRYDHVPEDRKKRELILVRNEFWVNFDKLAGFTQWEHTCSQVLLDAPPFVVSRCAPNSTLLLK